MVVRNDVLHVTVTEGTALLGVSQSVDLYADDPGSSAVVNMHVIGIIRTVKHCLHTDGHVCHCLQSDA